MHTSLHQLALAMSQTHNINLTDALNIIQYILLIVAQDTDL